MKPTLLLHMVIAVLLITGTGCSACSSSDGTLTGSDGGGVDRDSAGSDGAGEDDAFASQLVVAGVPLKAVQELLGHSTIEMTMRYAHLSRSTLEEAVARLDRAPAFGQPLGSANGGGAQLTEITSGK